MAVKEEQLYSNNHDDFFRRLSEIITLRHHEFLRITNHELLMLYWRIGSTVKNYLQLETIGEIDSSKINYLSEKLQAEFGPTFTSSNIRQMVEFSTILPDIPSFHEFALISWNHIQALLSEKTLEGWKFYLKATLEEGLNPNELTEQISSNLFGNSQGVNHTNGKKKKQKKSHSMPTGTFSNLDHSLLQNYFVEPLLSTFQKLMKPKENVALVKDNIYISKELLIELNDMVLTTQNQHAKRLNSRFNKFFYEMAGIINEELASEPAAERKSSFEALSGPLIDKYKSFFHKDLLLQMYTCAKEIPEILIFIRIANMITWAHLLVLLPLKKIEAILFYTRLTADKGLSVIELSEMVINNAYEKTDGAAEIEINQVNTIKSFTSTTTVEKQGNNIFKMTEQIVDFGKDMDNSRAVTNIFDNRYFTDFITIPYFIQ